SSPPASWIRSRGSGRLRHGSRKSTCPIFTTRWCCSTTIRRSCTSERTSSSNACGRTWKSHRRCVSGCPTSITSICGLRNACTSGRAGAQPRLPPADHRRPENRFKGGSVARKERYLVGLDVGTAKISAIVGEATEDGALDIIGIGVADSRGIRRGVVVNLEAAVDSIKKAIEEAELTAGIEIDSVHLGLSGAHVKAFNSRGVVAVAGKNREITREDVRRAIDAAKAVALPSGREILHVLPQDFVVDEQDGIG